VGFGSNVAASVAVYRILADDWEMIPSKPLNKVGAVGRKSSEYAKSVDLYSAIMAVVAAVAVSCCTGYSSSG